MEASLNFQGPISVTDLNALAGGLLKSYLPNVWVEGEVQDFKRAGSGHWYFKLKDSGAVVECAMFSFYNRSAPFVPKAGDTVQVRASAEIYAAGGRFQLVVKSIAYGGLGRLYAEFLSLKNKLECEGLFSAQKKLALPGLAKRIGVVTSLQAAALQDVLKTLKLRAPYVKIIIYPCLVQGEGAAPSICQALERAFARHETDVLLLVRGGGSLQDLWPFNEESVARVLARRTLPVITGIGHETDTTIADFVADFRAVTPTAAAQKASVPLDDLLKRVSVSEESVRRSFFDIFNAGSQRLDWIEKLLREPRKQIEAQEKRFLSLSGSVLACYSMGLSRYSAYYAGLKLPKIDIKILRSAERVRLADGQIRMLMVELLNKRSQDLRFYSNIAEKTSPQAILKRGYALLTDEQGKILRKAEDFCPGTPFRATLSDVQISAEVKKIKRGRRL